MNTRIISYVISNLFKLMMFLLLFPLAVSIYYREGLNTANDGIPTPWAKCLAPPSFPI